MGRCRWFIVQFHCHGWIVVLQLVYRIQEIIGKGSYGHQLPSSVIVPVMIWHQLSFFSYCSYYDLLSKAQLKVLQLSVHCGCLMVIRCPNSRGTTHLKVFPLLGWLWCLGLQFYLL